MSTTTPRLAYYASEAIMTDDRKRYMVAAVEENSPGFFETTYTYPVFADAMALADSVNESLGLTPEDVHAIVASSMAAGRINA